MLASSEKQVLHLFDKLSKTSDERKTLRDNYIPRGARQELVNWLRGKLAPTGQTINVSTNPQASQTEASTAKTDPQASQAGQTQTSNEPPKRGRGRPRKDTGQQAHELETQQEDDTSTESTTSGSTIGGSESATEEQPEQKAEPKRDAVPTTGELNF